MQKDLMLICGPLPLTSVAFYVYIKRVGVFLEQVSLRTSTLWAANPIPCSKAKY